MSKKKKHSQKYIEMAAALAGYKKPNIEDYSVMCHLLGAQDEMIEELVDELMRKVNELLQKMEDVKCMCESYEERIHKLEKVA